MQDITITTVAIVKVDEDSHLHFMRLQDGAWRAVAVVTGDTVTPPPSCFEPKPELIERLNRAYLEAVGDPLLLLFTKETS